MSFFQGWTIPVVDEATHQHLAAKTTELEQRLRDIATRFGAARFASSLAVEDMVITDVIARLGLNIEVFTLETGRLNPETSALIPATEARYGIKLRVMTPNEDTVKRYVNEHGRDAFYESVDLRRECCRIRKIEPLNRKDVNDEPTRLAVGRGNIGCVRLPTQSQSSHHCPSPNQCPTCHRQCRCDTIVCQSIGGFAQCVSAIADQH